MKSKAIPLFLITLIYFTLPFVNILFALAAIACFTLPFIILNQTKKKTWCSNLCPRADLLTRLKIFNIGFRLPGWFNFKKIARIMIYYFSINIIFIAMSSLMVGIGRIEPIEKVRLLIVFQLPWNLPQLLNIAAVPSVLVHLSYRFYSLMLTSTLIGGLLSVLFKPRSWCGICPINTLSTQLLLEKDQRR